MSNVRLLIVLLVLLLFLCYSLLNTAVIDYRQKRWLKILSHLLKIMLKYV